MKKISIILAVVAFILGGVYYAIKLNQEKQQKMALEKERSELARAFKVHFLKKGNNNGLDYGMPIKFEYQLFLVDKNRPDLKGKLVENRKYLGKKEGEVFLTGAYLPGIEKAILQMTENSEAWVYIPWELGYGAKEVGGGLVPAQHDLVAVIKILPGATKK